MAGIQWSQASGVGLLMVGWSELDADSAGLISTACAAGGECGAALLQFLLQVSSFPACFAGMALELGCLKKIGIGNNLCDLELIHKVAFASLNMRGKKNCFFKKYPVTVVAIATSSCYFSCKSILQSLSVIVSNME